MDSFAAMAMGMANRGQPLMVFDWEKAALLIRERQPQVASAGLAQDWEWTGGVIYQNNAPVPADETYVYLASTWATPELSLDGEIIECYRMRDAVPDSWYVDGNDNPANIYWPPVALTILLNNK